MAKIHKCDICKKDATITKKILYCPIGSSMHSNYTHILDVGQCCEKRILEVFPWRQRKVREKKSEIKKGTKK